ncbi:MAG: dihydroorotate dehydrogenase [Candidatus Omnitrophica bacterium]|nr:dihydroorotate dehydrogenase [Candidatus Omnitrophota bacterium]MBU1932576.1 dihydroorotate dehydrogenase [Candidatus Omnitrophota bacterium]
MQRRPRVQRKQNNMVKIGKINLKNPVMVASGTFGYAEEFEGLIDLKKLGAIVTKTITLDPKQGNPMPRICETASGMLNAIGLQNKGVDNFIEEKLPYLSKIGVPVIVSVSGDCADEFCELAKRLDREKHVDGIELNLSCPNIKARGLIAQDKEATYETVKSVREKTGKTLIAKLSPNVTDIVEIAEAACEAGADSVSLINTLIGMAIDVETGKPKLGNITGGLSGPCIKPIALRMVWEVAKNIDKPVIGMGGIMTAQDAVEFLIAGAKAVQIGTASFIDPGISGKIIKGVEKWTKTK